MTDNNSPLNLGLLTDRSKGLSDFNQEDRFIKVRGTLANVSIKPNSSMERGRLDFHINPVTEVVRAGQRQTDPSALQNGVHVSFDYGEWDSNAGASKPPKKNSLWFEVTVPAFTGAGYNTESGETLQAEIVSKLGEEITFEEGTRERVNQKGNTYEVLKRDPDSREVLPPLNEEQEDVFYQADKKRWTDAAEFAKETASWTGLLPVEGSGTISAPSGDVEAPASTDAVEGDPAERAAELFAAADGDYDAFKVSAIDDEIVKQDSSLRNEIILGNYEPVEDEVVSF
jgi:hypothetical protein